MRSLFADLVRFDAISEVLRCGMLVACVGVVIWLVFQGLDAAERV